MVTLLVEHASLLRLSFVRESAEHGDLRRYYVACAPWLAVLVLRNGLDLETVARRVVNADLTIAPAPASIARPGNADKPHKIMAVHSLSDDLADVSLTLAMEAMRDDGQTSTFHD